MLRFYLDEHVADAVAQALRAQGIDIQTAIEAKMAGHSVPDPIQLSWASVQQRTFVTGDWDFLKYGTTVAPHSGVIIIPRSVSL
jgi:predicted nuclease of predicted toxin-antitoxin system